MRLLFAVALATTLTSVANARISVMVSPGATAAEQRAAKELEGYLRQMGADVAPPSYSDVDQRVIVGDSPFVRKSCPDVPWDRLGPEELVVRTVGQNWIVAGGKPRGTVYGVYRFLHHLGVRWWAPWATSVPHRRDYHLPPLNFREAPAFEYREPYWFHAFDQDWSEHNLMNGTRVDALHGGGTRYAGFVHTFYPLVPPEKYFATHPEWYSLINGKRTTENAQLCTTNPEMRKVMLEEVRRLLRADPAATIVSVSQNDCFNPCQCDRCQALAKAEGSESAPVLDLANYVADGIRDEFPNVAVDTLAYQYTRHAPRTLKPRPNVIVRLCSIECDFGVPLTHPRNKSFADDIRDWSRLTNRLYVWDYVTDFGHYVQPFPNTNVIGPNLRFFSENGVKGVFEEGDYNANGGDLAELKAWLMAQMLWNPKQDPAKLRDEFLRGYYGFASRWVSGYIKLMDSAAADHPAHVFDGTSAGYLSYPVMRDAERFWSAAEHFAGDPEILRRLKVSHLSVGYVWLRHWSEFRRTAQSAGDPWPMPESRKEAAAQWLSVAEAGGPAGWSPVTVINEGNFPAAEFARQMSEEIPPPPVRHTATPLAAGWVDIQDDRARLWNEPFGAAFVADTTASDGGAVRMPGSHHEWAFQIDLSGHPGKYHVIVVARAEGEGSGVAFTAGIYDARASRSLGDVSVSLDQASGAYKAFDLGPVTLGPQTYVWVAPPADNRIKNVWIDRVYLVPTG